MKLKQSYEEANTEKEPNIQKLTISDYDNLYNFSISNPESFWAEQAKKFITWSKPWNKVSNNDFKSAKISWFEGATLNVSYNCLDRHLATQKDKPAIIWEGNEVGKTKTISYQQLFTQVCKFANVLKSQGVKKGDTVCIYMPMIPEIAIAMLACTRIGALHSVVFGGFSPESLRERIKDCNSKIIITADQSIRGKKLISLKENVDKAIEKLDFINKVIVIQNTKNTIAWDENKNSWYHELMLSASEICDPLQVEATAPLFVLYTSGSTGKPKGIVHATGGYLLHAAMSFKDIFDYKPNDIFWCTADAGWVTGHTYVLYGPLANGAATFMYEGVPNYPDCSRTWDIIDNHKISIFYTAPTFIRSLIAAGDQFLESSNRNSLRILGTVGEPINPEAWRWFYEKVGKSNCEIVDTWWQTETGGALISPLANVTKTKPGSACLPFFGVEPCIVDEDGKEVQSGESGYLIIKNSWPGQMQTILNDHNRFYETYFAKFPGYYFSGDGAKKDLDNYYWITGRVDDVLNVSGHRVGSAELESSLVLHKDVAEAAVVGIPHPIKGESIFAFVRLIADINIEYDKIISELKLLIKNNIGSFATPEEIKFVNDLPKTRSGKIMRRILRKLAIGNNNELGDTTTLENPNFKEEIV